MSISKASRGGDISRKFLTFMLQNETYGISITVVQEIVEMATITVTPNVPAFVKGVINLRGKVLHVVDLRKKLGFEEKTYTKETCIIIVTIEGTPLGMIVDTVCEVMDFKDEQIETMSSLVAEDDDQFVIGMGKVGSKVVILLDLVRAFCRDNFRKITTPPIGTDTPLKAI
jgi:purine-binding chemotaxis protein CheW